jgi:hypothetical protein
MVHAFACIAGLQLAQVQTRTKVFAAAAQNGGFGVGRQVVKGVAKGQDEFIVQGVAFGSAGDAHHGHIVKHFKVKVGIHKACFLIVIVDTKDLIRP